MSSLFDYDEREAPIIQRTPRIQVPVPAPEMEGVAGTLCMTKDGQRAYVTDRTRSTHFFRKHKGYAVSRTIIRELDRQHVHLVLVNEEDTGTLLQYEVPQFVQDGLLIEHESGDPQLCVPEYRARTWQTDGDLL